MPQSCLLPLLGLVASAQRVDDRHHHEAAWDHVDRACTVAIDAQKVTLRRTGDAAGPRLCAAELGGAAPRAGFNRPSSSRVEPERRALGARALLLNAAAPAGGRGARATSMPPAATPRRARARARPRPRRTRARASCCAAPTRPPPRSGSRTGRTWRGRSRPEAYLEAAGADATSSSLAAPRGEPPAGRRRGAARAPRARSRRSGGAAATPRPDSGRTRARARAGAGRTGLHLSARSAAAAPPSSARAATPAPTARARRSPPSPRAAWRRGAALRACSWGALFWLAVGACCGVPWVGRVLFLTSRRALLGEAPGAGRGPAEVALGRQHALGLSSFASSSSRSCKLVGNLLPS